MDTRILQCNYAYSCVLVPYMLTLNQYVGCKRHVKLFKRNVDLFCIIVVFWCHSVTRYHDNITNVRIHINKH